MDVVDRLPGPWRDRLAEIDLTGLARTLERVADRRRAGRPVYPPAGQVFRALELTAPADVRVVILGQDPYPGPGMAHGLAFSVAPGAAIAMSLRNIVRSLDPDLRYVAPASGSLEGWARQGVLLLNTILTVDAGAPGSHAGLGWGAFTDAIIRAIAAAPEPIVFLLWGRHAAAKASLIPTPPHVVLRTSHPSPLSVRAGFFDDRPLQAANAALRAMGRPEIDWAMPPG